MGNSIYVVIHFYNEQDVMNETFMTLQSFAVTITAVIMIYKLSVKEC